MFYVFFVSRPSMSQGTVMMQNRSYEKDFTVATPEEFVKRFNGTKVINKVVLLKVTLALLSDTLYGTFRY